MKELTYAIVEPCSCADSLHGPFAMIEPGFPVVILAPSGLMLPKMQSFTHTLKQQEAETIDISCDLEMLGLAHISLTLPSTIPEWASPIATIIPG